MIQIIYKINKIRNQNHNFSQYKILITLIYHPIINVTTKIKFINLTNNIYLQK